MSTVDIATCSEEEFVKTLNTFLLPSSPIRREELLRGRSDQLDQIRKALVAPGRNVFVYGQRGVGKTSLAQTAAYLHQSSDGDPIVVGCDSGSEFSTLTQGISSRLLGRVPVPRRKATKYGAGFEGLSFEMARAVEEGSIPKPSSVDEAVELVRFAASAHSKAPVVVVDEFEVIRNPRQRALFGDFVKQLGDQGVEVKFIFCGIGESLSELLSEHPSAYRYLAGVKLTPLGFEPRMEIITDAAAHLQAKVGRDYLFRIAVISDGFPHFIHLIGTKVFWQLFEDASHPREVMAAHFTAGIQGAVRDVEPQLKASYRKATEKYGDDYQYVLWALADHPDFVRPSRSVWESYESIMAQRPEERKLTRTQFNNRMSALKRESHGHILKGTRQGWYQFSEPIMRGYCRLKAEERGIQLGRDHPLAPEMCGK